jgi:hypothetical protein
MKSLVAPLIDKQQWLAEFAFDRYDEKQKAQLWDLLMKAMETKALDVLLDQLNQNDQRALIQHLSEDDLADELESFLTRKIPYHHDLLREALMGYKVQLKRDLARVAK